MKVAVLGCGYVGLVTGVCLAAKGHIITCVDIDRALVGRLNAGTPHIYELGLPALLTEVLRTGRFRATADLSAALADAEIAIIAVGTPTRAGAIDLTQVRRAGRDIGTWLRGRGRFLSIVVKSTVVPGTTDGVLRAEIEEASGLALGAGFGLGMNPEFQREGEAVADFMAPDRIVLGHDDARTLGLLEELYASFECDKIRANSRTAEMIKYANNALLAVQISAVNEIANLAAAAGGIDAMAVMRGVHLDRRWNPIRAGERVMPGILSYLSPGPGFGGSCLPKDLQALAAEGGRRGMPMRLLQAVLEVNQAQPGMVVEMLERAVGSLEGRHILLLGLAFKPGTDDVRDSASLRIAELLLQRGVRLTAHDPLAGENFMRALGSRAAGLVLAQDWRAAVSAAGLVMVATKWPEYRQLATLDLTGKTIFDARRMFEPGELTCEKYLAIGLGS